MPGSTPHRTTARSGPAPRGRWAARRHSLPAKQDGLRHRRRSRRPRGGGVPRPQCPVRLRGTAERLRHPHCDGQLGVGTWKRELRLLGHRTGRRGDGDDVAAFLSLPESCPRESGAPLGPPPGRIGGMWREGRPRGSDQQISGALKAGRPVVKRDAVPVRRTARTDADGIQADVSRRRILPGGRSSTALRFLTSL